MDHEGTDKVNILIVKLSAIGDVIHTLPSLAALRRLYPKAHITWVIEEAASDLIKGHPDLNRVLVSGRKRWLHDLKTGRDAGKTLGEIRTFLRALRDRPYDLVIDFHGLLKSGLIVLLSGGKRKLGYDSLQEMSGLFLTEKIPEDMGKHAVDRYLDFLDYLGAGPRKKPEFLVPFTEENIRRAENLLKEEGIGRQDLFAVLSPVALWETKLWEDRKFAQLGDRIARELGLRIVLTGGDAAGNLSRIQSMMKEGAVNLGGKTSLKDLAALYKLASFLVTTDSGPMHLAAAVGTPVIALFGPTSPARTGPYGEGHTVIRTDISCSPCFKKKCETVRCMKEITVEEVFQTVKNMAEKK